MIDSADVARDVLDPMRARILAALHEPASASTVAESLGESRQKVNYHVRALEAHGLIRLIEERPRRGLMERVMIANARSYVLSPAVLGDSAADPSSTDRLSAQYLVAVAARLVREVGDLTRRSAAARKSLATLTIDTEIRFASASDRAAFTNELSSTIRSLTARYHDESATRGRWHRLVVAAHPSAGTDRPETVQQQLIEPHRTNTDPIPTDHITEV